MEKTPPVLHQPEKPGMNRVKQQDAVKGDAAAKLLKFCQARFYLNGNPSVDRRLF